MRSIPVDLRVFEGFLVSMLPEPRIANPATGEVRKDRATNETVYQVGLVAMRGRDSSVIQVSVVGEPKGLTVGMQVRPVELEGSPWDVEGRSGVAWRASAVVPAGAGTGGPSGSPAGAAAPDSAPALGRRAAGSTAAGAGSGGAVRSGDAT
jgi:hypothetical protein